MAYIKSYKELIVWQKSIKLIKEVFILTTKFPHSEIYGIISQMRRAAIPIPSNIAGGYGRTSSREYAQFYAIAYGSALEPETQVIISLDLHFTQTQEFDKVKLLLEEVCRMLNSMIAKVKQLNARR